MVCSTLKFFICSKRDIAIVRVSHILGTTTPVEMDAVAQFVAPHAPIGCLVEVNDMRCRAGEMSGRLHKDGVGLPGQIA
jgi:hypothetical protein